MVPTLKQDLLKETFIHNGKPFIFSDTVFEKLKLYKNASDKDVKRFNLLREIEGYKEKSINVDNKHAIPLVSALRYIFRHCDDFSFCSKIAHDIEKKLFKDNESHENSILGIYKTVADGAFKDTYFENIYQNEALSLSSASTAYECHKEEFTEKQWHKILFFEHHFSLSYPDSPYELNEEVAKRRTFLESLQVASKYASVAKRDSEKAFTRRKLRKIATEVENSVEIVAGSIHLPSVLENQIYRYLTEKHPKKIQTIAVADIESSEKQNSIQVYAEIEESVNVLETTFQQVAEDVCVFLCNKHAVNVQSVIFFDKGTFAPYIINSNVARFTLRDDILTRKIFDKTVFSWRPQTVSDNYRTTYNIQEKCEACFFEDLPDPLDISRFNCINEWLLDVPLSIQVFMEAFLNKDSFKRAVTANQLLYAKLEKLYLTYDTLLNTYNRKYMGLLQEANTEELVMNYQNVNTVFSITSGSGITMSLPAAERKLKAKAADDLRYYNTFLKRHPFNYTTENGEVKNLVSLRQCHLILMMDNLVRLKKRDDSIRSRGDPRTHQLCTLPITMQGIPKDSVEVYKWHEPKVCDGSRNCFCKEPVKLPGDTVKQVLINLNEKEEAAMELFQSLCTWGHPQIWNDIDNTEISVYLRAKDLCASQFVSLSSEEDNLGNQVPQTEIGVQSAEEVSETVEDILVDECNDSSEDDDLLISDESVYQIEEEEEEDSADEMTDEDDVDLVYILRRGVQEIDSFTDKELFSKDINISEHDFSTENAYADTFALEQSMHDLSIDNAGYILTEPFQEIDSAGPCTEGFSADVSVLESPLQNLSVHENKTDIMVKNSKDANHFPWSPTTENNGCSSDNVSDQNKQHCTTTDVEQQELSVTTMPFDVTHFASTQNTLSDLKNNDHSDMVSSNKSQNDNSETLEYSSSDLNQCLPEKFGFQKNKCATLLCRHPPPAIGQDNDIHVLQRVLDDILVKSGYQDKSLTAKEDKILFGPDNKIGSNLIELMKRKKKYEIFLPEFPLLHLRKSKITTLISAYKNAGLTQLLRYMLDDEKKEWAKLVDPTDIDIATTKISRVSKALHLALLVRFLQTLASDEATSLIESLQTQTPESTASQWNTKYQHFVTTGCKRNATFELHVDIMRHCDEVLAIKLAERLGGESGYQLLLAATKSSLIFAFLNGATYYAPFCTQLLLHHYSAGPFYRNMKYNLFSTPSTQSNLNMSGDTKREMDHRDVLRGFRTGSTLSSVSWRMALIDPLNEVHRIRRQGTKAADRFQDDDLGWKTTANDLTFVYPLAELILKKGGLSFEEDLLPYNVYANQVVVLQSSVIDSLTSCVGQFLLERYIQKENLADLKTELIGNKTIAGPKELVDRAKRSKGTTMKRTTQKVAVLQKTAREVTEEKRQKKLLKTIKQAQHLSSAMNTCQALVKPDCSKPKVQKSSGMPKALMKILSMNPSSLNVPEISHLVALNQKSIQEGIINNIRMATAEFAGVKYKVKAETGIAYLKCVENTVIQPILHMFPKLDYLALCEEKYSYTPNDFKAYTREQRKKKNANTISHLKAGSAIISDSVFCQSSAVETEEGKRLVSNYLAQNVHRLNVGRPITLDVDSELYIEKECHCQMLDCTCGCPTYAIPIRCSFSSQALQSVEKLTTIRQRKGEAEMSQVDWLFNYLTSLKPGQAIASIVTSGDIDAIPIHLFALSRKWPKNNDGKYRNPVYVVLQKLGRRVDVYNVTGILEHLERTYSNELIGLKIALGLCLGGNDFVPKLHGFSHEKVLVQSLEEKFIDSLFLISRPQLEVKIDIQTYIEFVKCLYCRKEEGQTKSFEEVRLSTITKRKSKNLLLTNDNVRNPELWMPPRTALISVAGIIDLQITYLQTVGINDSALPDFLQKGCLKRTESGEVEYDFGPDVHIESIKCLQPDSRQELMTKPKPSVKRRQDQSEAETPQKGYRRKRQMTSTPAKK